MTSVMIETSNLADLGRDKMNLVSALSQRDQRTQKNLQGIHTLTIHFE